MDGEPWRRENSSALSLIRVRTCGRGVGIAGGCIVSCRRAPIASVPPDRPHNHAADSNEHNRQQPGVNQALEGQGELLYWRRLNGALLGCRAFHETDSAFRGLAALRVQDLDDLEDFEKIGSQLLILPLGLGTAKIINFENFGIF